MYIHVKSIKVTKDHYIKNAVRQNEVSLLSCFSKAPDQALLHRLSENNASF